MHEFSIFPLFETVNVSAEVLIQIGTRHRVDLCRNCGENPIVDAPYCCFCWENMEEGLRCKRHGCLFEDYSGMTDCGVEWDIRCPMCYDEDMQSNIEMAEAYASGRWKPKDAV